MDTAYASVNTPAELRGLPHVGGFVTRTFSLTALGALALLTACARTPPPALTGLPEAAPLLASRLVLALDGIDYRDVVAARARGLFGDFRAPSRLISTFPSISDIAWHEILGLQPTPGYQRIYFSNALQTLVGGQLDAITPIEFEERMDIAFGTRFHHLSAYLAPDFTARREIDGVVHDFFSFTGRQTLYVYNVGPDALQHTKGDLNAYLEHLDLKLRELQAQYRERVGSSLEIVVLSDHGHNKSPGATFLPVEKSLKARGFHVSETLREPNDVAFSVDGVTTGFGVFSHPDSVAAVAQIFANMEGVELATYRVNDSTFVALQGAQRGTIVRRHHVLGDRYRYDTISGDPLAYREILERMRRDHALDADGFADTPTWIDYTAAATFPVALVRIARGHTDVARNPAPILVSVATTHRIGLGLAAITDRIISLGGTHGSLSIPSSLGVLMTNFKDTRDDITASVRQQLDDFADLPNVKFDKSGARLTSEWVLAHDPRNPFLGRIASGTVPNGSQAIELWLTAKQLAWARNDGAILVEMRRSNLNGEPGEVVGSSYLPLMSPDSDDDRRDGVWVSANTQSRFYLPLAALRLPRLTADASYIVRVALDRRNEGDVRMRATSARDVGSFVLRTTSRGDVWPY